MELATAALGSLLSKLGTLLIDEYKLHERVRGEIKFLKAEMESMQAALQEVSKVPAHQIRDLDKIWARELKELCYDIEDSVDTFMVRIDDAPVGAKPHSFRSFFYKIIGLLPKAKTRHHIADDIEDIKSRIHDVAARRKRYKFKDIAAQPDTTVIDPRVPALFEEAAKLVGTDGPTEKISNLLTQGTDVQKQKLMVVSIVGVGGLGKTTVAKLVYERLRGQFDCRAFVSVSLKPNMKQILSSILRQVSSKDKLVSKDKCTNAGEMEPDELIRSIREFLNDKRYFIVIDDLWNEEAWKFIKCALIDNNLGSKIIVTTRNVDVANLCSVDGAMYELDPLSYEDSKRLLCKRIFNEVEGIHSELEEVAKKILKKCGGVPLAIITIASMLASLPNKTKYEWYRIYNSMGSGLEKDKTLESMRGILSLSYNDLPYYLKPCLLYLSMFPEDYVIPRDSLVHMWVAEGFIIEEKGRNLYEVGERYFSELVNRSMIQPVGIDEYGIRCGRVHDMILDLIISLSSQENFVIISEGPQLISSECTIRRLSLQGSQVDSDEEDSKEEQVIQPAKVNMSHVRSLVAFNDASQWMPPLSRFSVLRVLYLKYSPGKTNHPKYLGTLHHLRYLELAGKIETELLAEIGNLQLLKTLDLSGVYDIKELPASIARLRQLENLLIHTGVKLPDGIGNLMSLQEMGWLDAEESPNTLAELGNLTELRVLRIYGLDSINESHVKTFLQSLSNLHNIRTLFLDGSCSLDLDCMSDQWRAPAHLQNFNTDNLIALSQVPRWFSTLTELSFLSIYIRVLRQDDLQLLGALPVLRVLELSVEEDGTIPEERLVIGIDEPFRSLAKFEFQHYSRCWLVFGQGVMPRLQRLLLCFEVRKRECGGFDIGLENLTSLKHVKVKVSCEDARIKEVEDAETKIRDVIEIHPNHPTLELSRILECWMAEDENKGDREAPEQQSDDEW